MASVVQMNGGALLNEDTGDRSDDFSGFQRWIAPVGSASSPPPISAPDSDPEAASPRTSIVDCLLVELYDTYGGRRNVDSWDSSTEASGPDAFQGRCDAGSGFLQELQEKHTRRHQVNYLARKEPKELVAIIQEVKYRTGVQSAKLIRQLRRRDRLVHKLQKNYDIITACLQAVSQKRRVDTRLKFTIEPSVGKNGFQQWYDALKAVARLPTGIPKEWRKRVWLTLADQYLHSISIDWEKTLRFAFNERSNPDDDSLGVQIVKDLHRTGCSSYCGQEGEQDRVVLKRVLLAYARWNKAVGYCQGFNVLAALILLVTQGDESDALKVMIYLIDKVLPESYFANNLRALSGPPRFFAIRPSVFLQRPPSGFSRSPPTLPPPFPSVDMAVFRDLLRVKLPGLSQHLHRLQKAANKEAGGSYEPPLTNVFTMQWFLTMFATCLPAPAVLKIWDSVFFEGSEVLFRVALAIWERLGERILYCQTADEFYSTMGRLTGEMLERNLVDPPQLIQRLGERRRGGRRRRGRVGARLFGAARRSAGAGNTAIPKAPQRPARHSGAESGRGRGRSQGGTRGGRQRHDDGADEHGRPRAQEAVRSHQEAAAAAGRAALHTHRQVSHHPGLAVPTQPFRRRRQPSAPGSETPRSSRRLPALRRKRVFRGLSLASPRARPSAERGPGSSSVGLRRFGRVGRGTRGYPSR
ncbi:TBC1 domain family member 30 isoform X6 [Corythoichthys intestinalis]|uniref:TBC1 domain family member 30 isoform X6 n=1 Tax=Corythoichthys intestinalis TaxID=161448 RepID=UPI0025A5389B|nr:TBC1 domain family member 30 isoform X6 [Corythoichthys intestinalis]